MSRQYTFDFTENYRVYAAQDYSRALEKIAELEKEIKHAHYVAGGHKAYKTKLKKNDEAATNTRAAENYK